MSAAFKILSVWGIPIRIHVSLLVLLALAGLAAHTLGGFRSLFWNVALLVIVFTSIALHELAHSLVALRKGCRVREITLLFIGGAAQMEDIPHRPADEIQVALAGPLFSLALALLCLGLGPLTPLPAILPSLWSAHPVNLLQLAGQINLTLTLFNLLPAFPMDGGRVLRAVLARHIGRLPATFVASRLGRLAAIIMAVVGVIHGWWQLIVIAVFLFRAAGREFDFVLRESLSSAFGGPPPPPADDVPDDGQVRISPPPYARGRDSHAPLQRDPP